MSGQTSVDPGSVTLGYVVPGHKKPEYFRCWTSITNRPKVALSDMPLTFQTAFNAWDLYKPFTCVVQPHTYTEAAQWDCDVEYTYSFGNGTPQTVIKGHVHVRKAGHSLEWIAGHFWVEGVAWSDGKTPVVLRRIVEKSLLAEVTNLLQ